MRQRINRNAVASSYNYTSSRKAHIAMLKENHEKNSSLFMAISIECKQSKEDELKENLNRMYLEYKRKKAIEEAEFKAKFKAFRTNNPMCVL